RIRYLSITIALLTLPPLARPRDRMYSISWVKPNVRAREISLTNEVLEKSITAVCLLSLKTGWSKSIEKDILKPLNGRNLTTLSLSVIVTSFLIRINRLG